MNKDPRVIGVDPSFSGFGLSDGERTISFASQGATLREKCGSIYVAMNRFLEPIKGPMLWFVEKPFIVAGKGNDRNPKHPFNMGYMMSHIYDLAETLDVLDVFEIDHGKLKIFTTGTGAASKIDMGTHAFEKWGLRFRNDNECDAFALCQFGLAHLRGENPGVRAPKAKRLKAIA